jgi:hypothetical protein
LPWIVKLISPGKCHDMARFSKYSEKKLKPSKKAKKTKPDPANQPPAAAEKNKSGGDSNKRSDVKPE